MKPGPAGNDMLVGSGGNDLLLGAEGNDSEFGGAGNDVLLAGGGNDVLARRGRRRQLQRRGRATTRNFARDGVAEAIICGAGTDSVTADAIDTAPAGDCETFNTAP